MNTTEHERRERLRAFFRPGTTLRVKRKGKRAYQGTIRELNFFNYDGPVVVLDRPRSIKWVCVALPGTYTIGEKKLVVTRPPFTRERV